MKEDWSTIKKIIWAYNLFRLAVTSVSGLSPLSLTNALSRRLTSLVQTGKCEQASTPSRSNPVDIYCNNGALKWDGVNQRIYADGTPEVITVTHADSSTQTAGAENLFAVGNIADEQDIISGTVKRRCAAFLYDGTQTVLDPYLSTTGGKDNGAIIVHPKGAEYSGSIVSLDFDPEDEELGALSVSVNPAQDLNGYDSPWPAGGGVNLLDPAKCSAVGPSGAYGLTVTHDQATAIWTISGTPTSQNASLGFNFCTYSDFSLSGKGYQVQAFPISGTPIKNFYGFRNEAENKIAIIIDTVANPTVNMTFKVSVAATAQTAWTPYSNICPISGWTGANVYHSGADTSDATTYSITFPSEAGTVYGGTVDLVSGLLTINRTTVNTTWGSGINATNLGYVTRKRFNLDNPSKKYYTDAENDLKSNVIGQYNTLYSGDYVHMYLASTAHIWAYMPSNTAADTVMQFSYTLETPVTYQLTPTEVAMLLGENNLWSDAGDMKVLVLAPTTETVVGQPLKTTTGVNTLTVTAEVSDIPLAVEYKTAV